MVKVWSIEVDGVALTDTAYMTKADADAEARRLRGHVRPKAKIAVTLRDAGPALRA